ncbi:MAG: histidinol-phosphatase [Sulfurospirillum sp.]
MIVDLHNHTSLCNHAKGSMEDFVQKAIKKNIDIFGFSDHAPMNFDKKYRMNFEQMKGYEKEALHVKHKYKDEIEVLLGYEVDFLEGYIDKRVLNADVDYLIGSIHFLDKWGFDNPEFIAQYQRKDIDKIWEEYFDAVKKMAQSNLFEIVGHIDLIKVFKYLPKKDIRLIAKEAIKEIKKAAMVVELNSAGYRKPIKEPYPSSDIMELLVEFDIPITFCSDAHKPEEVGYKIEENIKYAKSYGYNKCAVFRSKELEMVNF